jgi:hypothetical protein
VGRQCKIGSWRCQDSGQEIHASCLHLQLQASSYPIAPEIIIAQRPKTQRQPDMVPSRVLAHRKAPQTCRSCLPVPTPDPQHIYRQQLLPLAHPVTNTERSRPSNDCRRAAHEQRRHTHLTNPALVYSRAESAVTRKGMLLLAAAASVCNVKPGDPKRTTPVGNVGSLLSYEPFMCFPLERTNQAEKLPVIASPC